MATYKELSKCILFYSAKDFLDSINKLFEYKFDKVPDQNKYIFMYRPINTTEWKVKAISFCVKNHAVQKEDDNYRLVTSIGNTDEDMFILDIKEYLENLMAENKTQRAAEDISKIRLGTPYAWTDEKEFQFLKEPGLLTLRIGNGWSTTKESGVYYNVGFGFNAWKHKTIQSRKRRLNETNETV